MDITVKSKYLKSSPRKVAPVLFMIRGKKAEEAMISLRLTNRKAATLAANLLKSALAIAKENDLEKEKMVVKAVFCNEGPRLKRRQIKARGRADAILKRMSHLTIVISDNNGAEGKKSKVESKAEEKAEGAAKPEEQSGKSVEQQEKPAEEEVVVETKPAAKKATKPRVKKS